MMVSSPVIVVIDIPGAPRWWDRRDWRTRQAPPDPKRRAKVKAARKAAKRKRKRKP